MNKPTAATTRKNVQNLLKDLVENSKFNRYFHLIN